MLSELHLRDCLAMVWVGLSRFLLRLIWNQKFLKRLFLAIVVLAILLVGFSVLIGKRRHAGFCKYLDECSDEEAMRILHKHESKCREILKEPIVVERRNDVWQLDSDGSNEMALYTAHLDPRDEYELYPSVVRVLGVGTHRVEDIIYCHLWYENLTRPVTTVAFVKDIGRGLENRKRFYMEYIYTCPLHVVNIIPRYVSLQFDSCWKITNILPISIPTNWNPSMLPRRYPNVPQEFENKSFKFQHQFGVCVPVTFGQLDPYRLVEWFEFHRLLGVTQFTMYTTDVSGVGTRALEHYDKAGILHLRKMTPPVKDFGYWSKKLSTLAALNRCLYQNMFSYRYLVIVDLDEIIIPYKTKTYGEMIESMMENESSDPPSWIFQNVYFWLDKEPKEPDPRHLRTLRFLKHAKITKAGDSAKSIVNLRKCVVVNNHHCLIRTFDVDDYWTRAVSPKNALLHHYKQCHLGALECRKSMKKMYNNNVTLKFKEQLTKNAEDVLIKLTLWAH